MNGCPMSGRALVNGPFVGISMISFQEWDKAIRTRFKIYFQKAKMAGFEGKLFCFLFARLDLMGGKDAEPKVKSIPPGEGVSQEGVDKLKHRRDVPGGESKERLLGQDNSADGR